MNEIIKGEIIEIPQRDWNGKTLEVRWEKYEVLQTFPYHVLCRNVRGGYRECFTRHQLRGGRRLTERMRKSNMAAGLRNR